MSKWDVYADEWKRMYVDERMSTTQIAEKYRTHSSTVRMTLKPTGCLRTMSDACILRDQVYDMPRRESPFKQYYKEWCRMYRDGAGASIIASKFDCDVSTVHNALRSLGVETHRPDYSSVYDKWIEMYKNGHSGYDIAITYGCQPKTVYSALRNLGVVMDGRLIETRDSYHLFDVIDSDEKAYWIGFAYADGNVYEGHTLRFQLQVADIAHLSKLGKLFSIDARVYNGNAILLLHSTHMANILESIGVVPRKTYVDSRAVIDNISPDLRYAFIRGMIDGDGCVCKSTRRPHTLKDGTLKSKVTHTVSISTCNQMCEAIRQDIIENAGTTLGCITKRQGCSDMAFGGISNMRKIYEYIYTGATVWLERKRSRFEEYTGGKI